MKTYFSAAVGSALGTLLYTGFISSAHEPDWGRAAVVGLTSGIVMALWPKKKTEGRK